MQLPVEQRHILAAGAAGATDINQYIDILQGTIRTLRAKNDQMQKDLLSAGQEVYKLQGKEGI